MDSGSRSSIVLPRHAQKNKKMATLVLWSTQVGELQTKYKSNIEILLPKFDATKIITWEFHVDNSQRNHKYDMILGRDIFSELRIGLFFSKILLE